jgi:iron complex transport system ATP-binding protein
MALHDLTQAYRVSDKIIMLNSGKVIAAGSPDEVLNPELISKVYGIPVIIIKEHKIIVPLF